MKTRWIALLVPAALVLAVAGTAEAGGYGGKHGYYSDGHGYTYGARHRGPRHHGFRGHGHRGFRHGFHRGSRHGFRHGFGHPGHRGFRHRGHGFGHGYLGSHHRSGIRYGLRHGHIRARHYMPVHGYGSITLHFGY